MPPRVRRRITQAKLEEIEEQQRLLSQEIVRPFEILEDLPISFNPPPNDVFKTPLTIKDTGVLYRSLMKLRYYYVHVCPMFKLYWVKQTSYAKKLAEMDKPVPKSSKDEALGDKKAILGNDISARDIMVKLCEANLTLGPHVFEIRLFIAKDDRSDKDKIKQEKMDKKEKKREEKVAELESKKAKIAARERKARELEERERQRGASAIHLPHTTTTTTTTINNNNNNNNNNVDPMISNNGHPPRQSDANTFIAETPTKPISSTTANGSESEAGTKEDDTEIGTETDNGSSSTTDEPKKVTRKYNKTGKYEKKKKLFNTVPSGPLPPSSDPNNMQSIENKIMISNLNAIARQDASLNSLMKVVALGGATPEQIQKFQEYIKRAREMGPQPYHAYLFQNQNSAATTTAPSGLSSENGGITPATETARKEKLKEKKIPKSKIPKEQKLTAFQERYLTDATIVFEFLENANIRFLFPKMAICEAIEAANPPPEDPEDKTDYNDILVSHLWVHNQSELDEYDAKLADYEKEVKQREEAELKQKQEEAELKQKQEEAELKQKQEEAELKREQEEAILKEGKLEGEGKYEEDNESAKVKIEAEGEGEGASAATAATISETVELEKVESEPQEEEPETESPALAPVLAPEIVATPRRRAPVRRAAGGRKNKPQSRKAVVKKLVPPSKPEIRFTSLTFTIHNIPVRFTPIIVNMTKPLEEVQQYMTRVLNIGLRLPSYYLWYQVDARLDESLAENIRVQLVQEEKKMIGVPTSQPEVVERHYKKRKPKDGAESKQKKVKKEEIKQENPETTFEGDINSKISTPITERPLAVDTV
ncbi:SWR1-complex protein 3 [Scheffersomyces spartinae]|uniref:SWR1-complex protein 3 n=1 Tax=Scheffersomyces spartinae TaxID=45513 RepID=A0A9P7V7S5_9ASCO|nr:SWR1-complex protein 3 [Scheffersomyces spartinae]KAG7192935.1 SWR1-complex protein 3 [Scheffersomyces spartinae]